MGGALSKERIQGLSGVMSVGALGAKPDHLGVLKDITSPETGNHLL